MKKIFAIVAVLVGLGTPSLLAANPDNDIATEVQKDRDYVKIANSEVPNEIRADIEKDHKGSTIEEAYMAPQDDGEKLYKIKIRMSDGDDGTVYYEKNDKGEYKQKVALFQKIGDKIKN